MAKRGRSRKRGGLARSELPRASIAGSVGTRPEKDVSEEEDRSGVDVRPGNVRVQGDLGVMWADEENELIGNEVGWDPRMGAHYCSALQSGLKENRVEDEISRHDSNPMAGIRDVKSGREVTEANAIGEEFVGYLKHLLGAESSTSEAIDDEVIIQGNLLTIEQQSRLVRPFTELDVRKALVILRKTRLQVWMSLTPSSSSAHRRS
ncbi:hypothetical protein Dimus_027846 [Dionaea muscipula]